MPKLQHTAHSRIDSAARSVAEAFAVLQQSDDPRIHLDRLFSGTIIDGFQIGYSRVLRIDIKELMVFQKRIMKLLRFGPEAFLRIRIDVYKRQALWHSNRWGFPPL